MTHALLRPTDVAIEDRFTDVELFGLFNIDIMPDADHKDGDRRQYDDTSPYAFNDIKCQLWSFTKRTLPRGERNALQSGDHLKRGISDQPPGSGRVEDLARYYQGMAGQAEISPFETE